MEIQQDSVWCNLRNMKRDLIDSDHLGIVWVPEGNWTRAVRLPVRCSTQRALGHQLRFIDSKHDSACLLFSSSICPVKLSSCMKTVVAWIHCNFVRFMFITRKEILIGTESRLPCKLVLIFYLKAFFVDVISF